MKIYFLLATQPTNLGDLLINKMLIDQLSLYGKVYVDAAGIPEEFKHYIYLNPRIKDFEDEYGGSLKRITALKGLPKVRNEFDYFFQSPGPTGGWGKNINSIIRKIIMSFEIIFLSSNKRIGIYMVGNDLNINSMSDILIEKILNRCYKHQYVRSEENRSNLKTKGFKNLDYIPDLSFLYNDQIESNYKNDILISFRDLRNDKYYEDIISFLNINIPFFLSKKMKVKFFFQVKSDEVFNYSLYNLFKDQDGVFFEGSVWYDNMYKYNDAKYLITNRLHVMLIGLLYSVIPFVLLNDDKRVSKIRNVMKDLGLTFLLVNNQTNLTRLNLDDHELYRKTKEIVEENQRKCRNIINSIFEDDDKGKR